MAGSSGLVWLVCFVARPVMWIGILGGTGGQALWQLADEARSSVLPRVRALPFDEVAAFCEESLDARCILYYIYRAEAFWYRHLICEAIYGRSFPVIPLILIPGSSYFCLQGTLTCLIFYYILPITCLCTLPPYYTSLRYLTL